MKKRSKNTKGLIISAAWKLFYEQGYDETTVEDIIEESGTSRGSFYHYFDGKDSLLGTLAALFDDKYVEIEPRLPELETDMARLLFLNRELFQMIENSISPDLLARLLSQQLTTRGEKYLLDRNRYYFKILRRILISGQESGEFTGEMSANEMVKLYAIAERALMYDWCMCNGEYSLRSYAEQILPFFLERIKAKA